ncbi:MAG: alpha-2-macroglobulin [Treponema sp.]|nr:alpha-2-macroglobulin [Treponema sp.]
MKKLPVLLSLLVLCLYFGCRSSRANEVPGMPSNVDAFTAAGNRGDQHGDSSELGRFLVNDAAINAAFTLDFRPLRAEPINEAETLSAAELSGLSAAGGGHGNVVGGGLRRLSDYQTVYFDPAREAARIQEIRAAQQAALEGQIDGVNEPLTVINWGPRGMFSSAIQRPSIYVIFSQPMVPLASLGEQSASSPFVTISPPIRGNFRWYGTSFLSFEGEEPCLSQQTYTITVSPNAASLSGNRISGDTVFSFHTETLRIRSVTPGEEWRERTNFHFDNNNVPPEAARRIGLLFNYPVLAADIHQYIEVTTNGASRRFTLRQDNEYKITVELTDTVNFETLVGIILKAGARSRGGTRGTETDRTFSFRTPGAFNVASHTRFDGWGRYGSSIVELNFSHNIKESTVLSALRTEPVMTITNENIEVRGNRIWLFNLPVNFGQRFTVFVAASVEDVYDRRMSSPFSASIVMPNEPPPVGSVNFPEYRHNVMLEAQFPPRYLFEYQNITPNSFYAIAADTNPFFNYWNNFRNRSITAPRINLVSESVNTRFFEQIDLAPYLNNRGKGFVYFSSNIEMLTRNRQRDETYTTGVRTAQSSFSIQVTDLGMTVRYGFNRAAVLVTSLATGKPVEGVTVKMFPNSAVDTNADLSLVESFVQAVTDQNGLAILNMDSSVLRNNININRGFWQAPFVMAEKDGDKAIFQPSSHNMWRSGVWTNSPLHAEEIVPLAFMFSDRGLYKPGETITFRGVDRSRVLGMYKIYSGDYSVTLEESSWQPTKIEVLNGTTTESGSFFGSITVPEDLQPGAYRLVYRRISDGTELNEMVAHIPITVAFFERLRFQAALSFPPEAVILGDDINLTLRASYLAGGSLSGASWEAAWFEETGTFRPSGVHTRGFVFGPMRAWDSKRHVGSESGALSGQGTATISHKTGGSRVTGAPYVYQAEARVTDLGNQMVTAFRSVLAHPASFYIGLSHSFSGFIRVGEEFTCNYITVKTSGELTTDNSLFLQSGEGARQIRVELIREEWRRVQQRGVSGFIHDEYTPHQITDSVQTINIQNGGGSIRLRPSAAGFHILRVTSVDMEGRTVLTETSFFVTGAGGYWNMNSAEEIRLVPDQSMYEPGDTAKVLLQSTLPSGYYLITVEREGIFTEEVRHFAESVTVIDIPIARNYVPVIYVSVSSYSVRSGPPTHEYGSVDLDKPKGFYGVTRLNVNPRVKAFSVNVQTGKRTYRPGEEVTITLIATRGGQPLPNAELTLMAVDRGVLDLINYRVPDPINHFYSAAQFPIFTAGGDSRSMLMDPITYAVRDRMGGDSNENKLEERSDFNPTAVFEPMLITDVNGRVTHTFKLPDNLTTYRVTVFGVRGDLFALKESEIAAQNMINVREVVPRRLRERDTAEVGVLITNLDSASHTINVKLDVGAPLPNVESSGLTKVTGHAFVDGTTERRVTVRSGENAVVYFDVAAVRQGNVTLNFTINSNILNERLVREMIIERPFVTETITTTGTVTGNSASEGFVIPSFADGGMGSLSLTLDATRLSLLDSSVSYLFHYPYGCLEQRSSAIKPLIIFGEYIDVLNLSSEVADPHRVIENELRSWAQIQLSNGGFPFWPTGTRANFYVSLRIAHTIAAAKVKGMNIPPSLNTASLVAYLNREYQAMQNWRRDSSYYYYQSYLQSYMLYVFALLGERVDPSRLVEMLSRDNVDPSVLAFVGMTYRVMERDSDATNVAQRLRNLMRLTTRGVDLTDPLEQNRFHFYGGQIEQLALCLQFFAEQFPGDEINTRLLFTLLENQRSGRGHWQSTAVTVRVLSAVDALIRAEDLTNIDVRGAVTLGAVELLQGTFVGLGAKPVTGTFDFSNPVLVNVPKDRMQQLNFTRSGRGNLYYTASLNYAIPSELQSFRDEGIGLFLTLYDVTTGREISGTALQSGRTYRARVRVSSIRDRTYLALRVPVPSGAEIMDMAFVTTATFDETGGTSGNDTPTQRGSWLSHQAIYDNEIQYFWDRFNRGESTVSFLFRTVRRGVYPTPPVQAELMYEPEIFGRTKGLIYTIE